MARHGCKILLRKRAASNACPFRALAALVLPHLSITVFAPRTRGTVFMLNEEVIGTLHFPGSIPSFCLQGHIRTPLSTHTATNSRPGEAGASPTLKNGLLST